MRDTISDIFAGRFFQREALPTNLIDGEWEPRAPYPQIIREMLGRTGLARRILALRALDATREGWEVVFPSMEPAEARKAAKRLDSMQAALATQLKIFLGLFKAEQHGEAIVVIGADDRQPLDQPLVIENVRDVLWLKVFAMTDYTPGPLSPPTSQNFDLPEWYDIADFHAPQLRSLEGAPRNSGTVRVHHTRVLRFATEEGYSRLDEVGQAIEDYLASMKSARRAASTFSVLVYSVKHWMNKWASNEDAAAGRIGLQAQAMKLLGAFVKDLDDEELEWKGQSVTGLGDLVTKAETQLCAWSGYPIMIFFGADPAGFSTGSEVVRAYYDTVHVWQTLRIEPQLRYLLRILMVCAAGPAPILAEPDDWSVAFRPLRVLSAEEQAKVRDVVARTVIALKGAQLLDRDEGRASLPRDGDDVPDVRLSSTAFANDRERLEVGIVQAVTTLVSEFYQRAPAPTEREAQALQAAVAAMIPELADRVAAFFTPPTPAEGAPAEAGDEVDSPTEADLAAEAEALAAAPEQWLEANDIRAHFSVSKATLKKYRAEQRGAAVDPGPGRYRWIAPDGRPRYKLSEVRAVLEAGVPVDPPASAPAPDPTTGPG